MSSYLGTFVLDFMSTNFEIDIDTATAVLTQLKEECGFDKNFVTFAILDSVHSAGWIFSKLFIAGQFVEKLYESNSTEIENSKGKKFSDKFVSWLSTKLKERGCRAQIKLAK